MPADQDYATVGRGNMGGTAANRITATGNGNPGLDTTKLGAVGGVDRHTLVLAQVPTITPTGVVTVTHPAHQYKRFSNGNQTYTTGAGNNIPTGEEDANTTPPAPTNHALALNNFGGGQAHPNLQPTRVVNRIIFTGVV